MDIWDVQLVKYGREIIQCRESFITQLNELIGKIHRKLSGDKENIRIIYDPCSSFSNLEQDIGKSRLSDKKQKTTLVGPHRDDIGFYIDDIDIRKFGSQGQQRTAALSLKLAEIELVKKMVKDYPILLLDDVLSELDGERQNHLLSAISKIQTMITCTGLDELIDHRFSINRLYRVADGQVTAENQQEEL